MGPPAAPNSLLARMPEHFDTAQLHQLDTMASFALVSSVKLTTEKAYRQIYRDYSILQLRSSLDPLPFTYLKVSRFLTFTFITPIRKSSPSASTLPKKVSALKGTAAFNGDPWLSADAQVRLKRLVSGFQRLDTAGVTRTFALVYDLILKLLPDPSHCSLSLLQ